MTQLGQSRDRGGKFGAKAGETKGRAIALRLPASLDTQVRAAAGWQTASREDNARLSAWVEGACKDRVSGATPPAPTSELPHTYPIEQIRAAADRVAMTVQPRDRLRVQKAFKALLGELLANGD